MREFGVLFSKDTQESQISGKGRDSLLVLREDQITRHLRIVRAVAQMRREEEDPERIEWKVKEVPERAERREEKSQIKERGERIRQLEKPEKREEKIGRLRGKREERG